MLLQTETDRQTDRQTETDRQTFAYVQFTVDFTFSGIRIRGIFGLGGFFSRNNICM